MARQRNRRGGFTLLELLVVLSIMGLLAAITISAVGRYKQSSIEKNTNTQLLKVQVALEQQYKGAIETIRKESVPQPIIDLTKHANGTADMPRAKALYMKLRLRQEFPQTFTEVHLPTFQAEFMTPPVAPSSQLAGMYPPKPVFQLAIGTPTGNYDLESAALLYLILTQSRAGSNFDVDNVGRVTSVDIGGRPMKVFLDYFDTPIGFRRWADAIDPADVVTELSLPPFVPPPPAYADVEDPDRRLAATPPQIANDWPTPANRGIALKAFIPNSAGVRPSFSVNVNPFDGFHRGPYAFSAGGDQLANTPDDLLSFRLQQAGKGN
jgi:prepilin-type N-terminal cleavage/methylation domain-containing protein